MLLHHVIEVMVVVLAGGRKGSPSSEAEQVGWVGEGRGVLPDLGLFSFRRRELNLLLHAVDSLGYVIMAAQSRLASGLYPKDF